MDEHEDEVIIEPEGEGEMELGSPEEALTKMRATLALCRKEKQEYMDGWQRAKADYVNLLKRFEAESKTTELRGKIVALETLLPAFDALERAKDHGEIPEGFTAIARQLENAFAALGLEEITTVGEEFNPAIHEALGREIVDSIEKDNKVTAVLEKGWRIGDTVIRPAKVNVSHFG
ncbi:MAG TPA: nucleotide exchange factor GrpE [Candidatus Paceibacterota bacterium]|nr:nucleotide exchange factor GrpE [Candidatus Paceibacterota bacterium]